MKQHNIIFQAFFDHCMPNCEKPDLSMMFNAIFSS